MKYLNPIQQAIFDNLDDFLKQKEETILNQDPDALHRMRVSGLKLRIHLWSFKLLLPVWEYNKIGREIRKICKSLNQARDLDVQISMLLKLRAKKPVVQYLKNQRIKLQPSIADNLTRIDKLKLKEKITRYLNSAKAFSSNRALLKISGKKINKKLQKLLFYADYVNSSKKLKKLHPLRIAAKHLRYTLELFQPIYAKNLNGFISHSRLIQGTLGDMRNYLILSKCRVLDNPGLKNKLIIRADRSYAKFAKTWKKLNVLISSKKTF